MKGDVYPVEPFDGSATNQVLDAHWGMLNEEDVRLLIIYYDASTSSSSYCSDHGPP